MARSRRKAVAVAVAGAVLVAAAAALAATPNPGTWTGTGEGGAGFVVKGSSIVPYGVAPRRYITAPSNFKCNSSNLVVKTSRIKIAGGRFSYDGPAYVDVFRAKQHLGRLVWSGSFTSATKVKGRVRFTSAVTPRGGKFQRKRCDSGAQAWAGQQGFGAGGEG